ncbi:hypothetical protein CRUP_002470 [Coryphaenoides rupestris]|nr:hypothetical protein CRUP_002470 [Coryphaenoides rupestris]
MGPQTLFGSSYKGNYVCGKSCLMSDQNIRNYTLKEPNDKEEYDIFTAPTTATYLIDGNVTCHENTNGLIFMEQTWKAGINPEIIQRKTERYSAASFLAVVALKQDSKVYLRFNDGKPTCLSSVFRVYKLG